jgi:hypothetical protein
MFGRVWANYFRDPRRAPPVDVAWLRGSSAATHATERALLKAETTLLPAAWPETPWPVLLLCPS